MRMAEQFIFVKDEQLEDGTYLWEIYERTQSYKKVLTEFKKEGLVLKINEVAKQLGFPRERILNFLNKHYSKARESKFYEAKEYINKRNRIGVRLITIDIEPPIEVFLQRFRASNFRRMGKVYKKFDVDSINDFFVFDRELLTLGHRKSGRRGG
ncbi:hypothetical protein ES703_81715 [subsurface metagenome]